MQFQWKLVYKISWINDEIKCTTRRVYDLNCCENKQELNFTVIDARDGLLRAVDDVVSRVLSPSLEKLRVGWGETEKPDEAAQVKTSLLNSLDSLSQVLTRK